MKDLYNVFNGVNMLIFDIITIFPNIFDSFLKESFIQDAIEKRLIKIVIHNLRNFTNDKHQTVDDRPFGGGIGMVVKVEPIYKAVKSLKLNLPAACLFGRQGRQGVKSSKSRIVLFSPRGKKFNQKTAYKYSKLNRIVFICGRYEGVDERVAKYIADEQISIGDFVTMGGEVPAMAVIESVSRLIPGVLGKKQLLKERITKEKNFIEGAQYTRPPQFFAKQKFGRARPEIWRVPKVLLSGDHKKINEWREKHSKEIGK